MFVSPRRLIQHRPIERPPIHHRPIRRWPALAASFALLASMLVAVIGAAGPASAEERQITEGTVNWGYKESWRNYIGQNNSQLSDGVTFADDGTYDWPVSSGTFDDETNTLRVELDGQIHYRNYPLSDGSWALDSTFKNLYIVISPTEQTIYGDYVGNPREGGETVVTEDAEYATIDLSEATVETIDGVTTWSGLKTFGGSVGFLYPKGSPFDPLTISYTGPGALPDTGEHFDAPGAPVLEPGATWDSGSTTEDGRLVFASEQRDLLHVVTGTSFGTANASLTVRALDLNTLQERGTKTIALGNRDWFQVAYDPDTESLFYATADAATPTAAIFHRLTYDPDARSYGDAATIGQVAFPAAHNTNQVYQLTWDSSRDELIAITGRYASATLYDGGQLSFIARDSDESDWQTTTYSFALPATGDLANVSRFGTMFGASIAREVPNSRVVVLRDGSYLLATGGNYVRADEPDQVHSVPAIHLTRDADGVKLSYVDDTDPVPISAAVTHPYSRVALAANGSALLHSGGPAGVRSVQWVDLVDGEAKAITGHVTDEAVNGSNIAAISDGAHGIDYVMSATSETLTAWIDREVVQKYTFDNVNRAGLVYYPLTVARDSSVILVVKDSGSGDIGLQRFAFGGITPKVGTQPQSQQASLATGVDSQDVTFTSAATGSAPEPERQWQVKAPGDNAFADLDGETGETLTVGATPGTDGYQYRAVYTNAAGRVVSDIATLSVDFSPRIVADVKSQAVTEGADAVFLANFDANPQPDFTWQRRVGGYWQDICGDDDNFTVSSADGVSTLTVKDTNVDQSDSLFRAKASNDVGSALSSSAKLTVDPTVTIPAGGLNLDGVVLDWSGSEEMQIAPPFGGSNFFSAGVSDGAEGTYRTSQGDVTILQLSSSGAESAATWETRAAHVSNGGSQLVRFGGGDATVKPDGSAKVTWDGAWSVNFYGGLVPFTITDPELAVGSDGTGTLTGDLSGYASSQDNPEERSPLAPVSDVTIATFSGVEIDPAGKVTVDPDYAGVELDVPQDETPQDATSEGWGSWPQEFVDFHFATGLSSYWYSSGRAADAHKKPSSFTVDFTGAEQVAPTPPSVSSTTKVSLGRTSYKYGSYTTARVTVAASGTTPTGKVTVRTAGRTISGTLKNGTVKITLPKALKPGRYPVSVSYPGAGHVRASTGSATFRVTKARPKIRATLVKSTVKTSKRARVRVTVTIPGGSRIRPRGQLVIRDGSKIVRTKTLKAGHKGRVTITLPTLSRGKHYLRTTISGSSLQSSRTTTYRTLTVK